MEELVGPYGPDLIVCGERGFSDFKYAFVGERVEVPCSRVALRRARGEGGVKDQLPPCDPSEAAGRTAVFVPASRARAARGRRTEALPLRKKRRRDCKGSVDDQPEHVRFGQRAERYSRAVRLRNEAQGRDRGRRTSSITASETRACPRRDLVRRTILS